MLIDDFLPRYDVTEFHEIQVNAPPGVIYKTIREMDFGRSLPILGLVFLRRLPALVFGERRLLPSGNREQAALKLNLDLLLENGFVVLADSPPEELVVGVVGKPWRPDSGLRRIDAADFVTFDEPGFSKAAWNFTVRRNGPNGSNSSLLTTETRVRSTDQSSRRNFSWYWRLIGPFSGLIRILMLRMIKRAAESS